MSAAPERMQAFVRLRPVSGKEAPTTIKTTEKDCIISITTPSAQEAHIKEYSFSFDGVLGPHTTQHEVYEAVMWQQVQALLEGRDTLTFAYGPTNAGKTYTVQGGATSEQRGVLPRALSSIFGARDTSETPPSPASPPRASSPLVDARRRCRTPASRRRARLPAPRRVIRDVSATCLQAPSTRCARGERQRRGRSWTQTARTR